MDTLTRSTNGFSSDALTSGALLPNNSAITPGIADNPYGLQTLQLSSNRSSSAALPITVTTSKDEIKDDGLTSLSEAINLANGTPGLDVIQFASSITNITLAMALPVIKDDLMIDGTDPLTGEKVTINGDGKVSLLHIDSGFDNSPKNVILNNLKLVNGRAQGSNGYAGSGGGGGAGLGGALFISNEGGSVTLIGVDFENNQAIGGDGAPGGKNGGNGGRGGDGTTKSKTSLPGQPGLVGSNGGRGGAAENRPITLSLLGGDGGLGAHVVGIGSPANSSAQPGGNGGNGGAGGAGITFGTGGGAGGGGAGVATWPLAVWRVEAVV